jgi:HAD superfamily hydrolase (TIGR01509 family)
MMEKPPLEPRVFIFDLFGVVIEFDNDIVYSRLARHCRDEQEAFSRLNGLMARVDVITGAVTLPHIYESLVETHGLSLSYEKFVEAWLEPYSKPLPGMAQILEQLSRSYKLFLLSNVDAYYWQTVRALHPELDYFDALLVSCELGLAKPDSAIFEHIGRMSGVDPVDCFFIDDTIANIKAADAMGFQTHLFIGVDALRMELKRRFIRVV